MHECEARNIYLEFYSPRKNKIPKMLIYHYSENLQEAGHIK